MNQEEIIAGMINGTEYVVNSCTDTVFYKVDRMVDEWTAKLSYDRGDGSRMGAGTRDISCLKLPCQRQIKFNNS